MDRNFNEAETCITSYLESYLPIVLPIVLTLVSLI